MSSSAVASAADYFLDVFVIVQLWLKPPRAVLCLYRDVSGSALFHTNAKFSILSGNSEA
jgi:hypothetical protein